MKKKKLISGDAICFGNWQIKASKLSDFILIVMYNEVTHNTIIQHVDDEAKANIIIEYILEKGTL